MTAQPAIRPVAAGDRDDWFRLWNGYLDFYGKALPREISEATWQGLLDGLDMFGLVATANGSNRVIGIVNCVLHANTWSKRRVCYLEDLFVDPDARGHGTGRALIEAVVARARASGWLRVYWQTKSDNATARRLYDSLTPATDWVRYDIDVASD